MKTSLSFLIYLCLTFALITSCSPDSNLSPAAPKLLLKTNPSKPENPLNPFDEVGAIHSEILESYFQAQSLPQSMDDIISRVGLISQANSRFQTLDGAGAPLIGAERAHYILQHPTTAVPEIFNEAAASERAKKSLKSFSDSLLLLCKEEQDYSSIYQYITAYENLVVHDSLFSAADQQLLLTSTAIARYTASKKKRPKRNLDTDWEINVFHVAGSIEGIGQSVASAVTTALCLGIAGNQ